MRYESTSVRSTPLGVRACRAARGAALARRLPAPPLPDPARQRPGPAARAGRRLAGMLLAIGPRRDQGLRRRGPGLPAPEVQGPKTTHPAWPKDRDGDL